MADFQPNKSYKKFFRNSSFKDVAYKGGNISDFTNDIGYSQVDTGSLITTSSFNEFTSSYNTGSFTGSFNGTFGGNIENAVTASYALTAQTLLGSVESASYSSTSSYLNPLNQEVIVTGSVYVIDSLDTLGRSLIDENNIISVNWGTQELVDTNENTSIDWENRLLYDAESTIVLDYNFKTFSGSVHGTSSWANNSLTASYLIGSVDSASYATTSSYATTAQTLLGTIDSASYATTSSYSLQSQTSINQYSYDAGIISGSGTWGQSNNGTITLPSVQAVLYDNPYNSGSLKIYDITGGTTGTDFTALTDNATNYICINYNNGFPEWQIHPSGTNFNGSSIIHVYTVYRLGNFIHVLDFGNHGNGLPNKINLRLIGTQRFARESGFALGISGSQGVVTLTGGVAWNSVNKQTLESLNSQDDIFFKNYHSASNWTVDATQDFVNNTYYDDGTDLVAVGTGKYLVNYYYRGQEINDHLYEVFSQDQYDNVADAQLSSVPSLPELITSHAFLLGRIIIQSGSTSGVVESAFTTQFQATQVTSHNDLDGIQGGVINEYFHLTSDEYNNVAYKNRSNNFTSDITITGSLITTGSNGILDTGRAILYSSNTSKSISYNDRLLSYPTNITALDWNNGVLNDSSGVSSFYWSARRFTDSSTNLSGDWQNRILTDASGNTILDWSTLSSATLNGTASYATTAQTLLGSVESASFAATASLLLGSVESASYASTSSYSTTSISSSYASSGNGTFSGSFSGSFQGDGSNITGISATPASGTVILLYSDETEDSGTNTTSNIKTYTVASNTYTKIMAECEVQLYGGDNVDCAMKYTLSIGGDAVRELTLQQAATGRGDIWILAGNLKTSTSFTSGGTVSVSVNETSNGGTYYIQSLRVYGVI